MSVMQTLDWVALCQMQNLSNIIEYSPYSTDIHLVRIKLKGTFGYEEEVQESTFGYDEPAPVIPPESEVIEFDNEKELITKGIIIYPSDRRSLEKINIYVENDLPMLGFFKDEDGFKVDDIIQQITHEIKDGDIIDVARTFTIIDIKSAGDLRTAKKIFVLAPKRD